MILRCSITLVALVSLAFPAGMSAADRDRVPATADLAPDGLSTSDWSGIRAAYEANRHAVFPVEDGYQARNPGQQWRTKFDGRGFETTPDAGGWSWGLELVSYGRTDLRGASASRRATPICVEAAGGRVSYEWDDALTEWFINDTRGLEHGFTVHKRPAGDADLLHVTLAVRGGLKPRISGDGRNAAFVSDTGAAVVNYNGLTVFDATGATIPAWFEDARGLKSEANDQTGLSPFAIPPNHRR